MPHLQFIEDNKLITHIQEVLNIIEAAATDAEKNLYNNAVDPFSALFDCLRQNISLEAWLEQEKVRQIQKTFQNSIGVFHQEVLGAVPGWESLGTGKVVDVINKDRKIIAEIKNKFNTTKGNHKVRIYDDFSSLLNSSHQGYTAYYVEIIPKGGKRYDSPFTPSDNQNKKRREANEQIRVIDGYSFYKLATGQPDALYQLYEATLSIVKKLKGINGKYSNDGLLALFKRAYKN